ncbi:MAG: peptidase M15 [Bacteroidetes bacterium]|nr:peptidase M15 [Bacteroidota bacterium]
MKNFKITEFDSPDLKGSGSFMDDGFLLMLDKARDFANVPFKINSGYRTKEHNSKISGSPTSSHLLGFAADISCTTSAQRVAIVSALIFIGFNRIGIASTFIHVDNDPNKPIAIWLY